MILSHFILRYSRIPQLDMDFFLFFLAYVRVCVSVRRGCYNSSLMIYRSVVVRYTLTCAACELRHEEKKGCI